MLDRLPVELVQHILQLAFPAVHDPKAYETRQTSLKSLSLVCRRPRLLAQPMLLEVVRLAVSPKPLGVRQGPTYASPAAPPFWADEREHKDADARRAPTLASEEEDSPGEVSTKRGHQRREESIKVLDIAPKNYRDGVYVPYQVEYCVNLQDLTLFQLNEVDFSVLSHCKGLRRLVIAECRIVPSRRGKETNWKGKPPYATFPALVELSLYRIVDNCYNYKEIANSTTFPSLRRLAFFRIDDVGPHPTRYRGVKLSNWPLDVLAIDQSDIAAYPLEEVQRADSPILVTLNTNECTSNRIGSAIRYYPLPAHLRLLSHHTVPLSTSPAPKPSPTFDSLYWRKFLSALKDAAMLQPDSRLITLTLPSRLRRQSTDDPTRNDPRDELLEWCKEMGVRVIWAEDAGEERGGPLDYFPSSYVGYKAEKQRVAA